MPWSWLKGDQEGEWAEQLLLYLFLSLLSAQQWMSFSNEPANTFVLDWQIVLAPLDTDKQIGTKLLAMFHQTFQHTCKKFWPTDFHLAVFKVLPNFFMKHFRLEQFWHAVSVLYSSETDSSLPLETDSVTAEMLITISQVWNEDGGIPRYKTL